LTSSEFLKRIAVRKVLAGPVDGRRVRMVTHVDVDRGDMEQALQVIAEVVGQGF
jgi:threonine aldolase